METGEKIEALKAISQFSDSSLWFDMRETAILKKIGIDLAESLAVSENLDNKEKYCFQCIHSDGVDLLEYACSGNSAMCVCYISEEAKFVKPESTCDSWKDSDGTVFRGDVLHKKESHV